jgi:hypothetical protein
MMCRILGMMRYMYVMRYEASHHALLSLAEDVQHLGQEDG